MRLWKVLVLLNLALGVGIGLGYLRWAREVRSLQDEIDRLRAQAARPSAQSWTARGIVRSLIPKLGAVFLTHEALPGLMPRLLSGQAAAGAHGSQIVNRLPSPGWLSTLTRPPCAWATCRTSASPTPLPRRLWVSLRPTR